MATSTAVRAWVALAGSTLAWGSTNGAFELRGKIAGGGDRPFRVTVDGIGQTFHRSLLTEVTGDFKLTRIDAGSYAVIVIRRGVGIVRRTAVVSPKLADSKGVVRFQLAFEVAEAVASKSIGVVSAKQLAVPEKALAKYREAGDCLTKKDLACAERTYRRAIEIFPAYSAALNALGVMAYQARRWTEAEQLFRKALDIEPNLFEPTVNLGGLMIALGRYKEGLPLNRKAVELRPYDGLANVQLGINLFSLKDFDAAVEPLKRAKTVDPSHVAQPQLYLAAIYTRRGDRDAAAMEIDDFLVRHPDDDTPDRIRRQVRFLARS